MKKAVTPAIASLIFLFYFFLFKGIGIDYWDTYIAAPATFVAGKPCVITNSEGRPSYSIELSGRLPQDLIDRRTYGIISKDQRIGAGVTFAIPYLAFGVIGFRLLYAGFGAMAFLFATAAARRLFDGQVLPILAGLIVSINPFMIMMDRLNANYIVVPLLTAFLYLLLEEKPNWFLSGLVYGAIGGIRNEAIIIAPAILLWMLPAEGGRKGLAFFGLGALLTISPYLYWNNFAFGKALIHASQYSDFDGWRPMFPHAIFGWNFELNGLFNWPFHTLLVRTPHYPFPTYFTLPLVLILCFGGVLTTCAVIGLFAEWKKRRTRLGFLALWIALSLGLFVFQENWEEPKTTFGALAIPPIGLLMVRGIEWIFLNRRSWRAWASAFAVLFLLECGIHGSRSLDFPIDQRWYLRFPKAKAESASIGCLSDEQRREWMLFHTDECADEVDFQKRKLTRGNLLPALYYPLRLSPVSIGELGAYNPPIFDIWNKIYGY
jgi:hypothetical protein